jgi:parallel beta-helix repeat protein
LLFANADAQSNVIEGNVINGLGNPASRGISFAQADSGRHLVLNNHVTRNAERGIYIESRGNRLSGNEVSNNAGEGVYITSTFNVVEDNHLESNGRSLQFTPTAQNNVYRNNVLRGNTNGVLDQGVNNTDSGGNVP